MKYVFIYLTSSIVLLGLISAHLVKATTVENPCIVEFDSIVNSALHYEMYSKQCVLLEDGFWENGRNVGPYKRFHQNGQLAEELEFDKEGKRIGLQKYFHKNGQASLIGLWSGGKVDGYLVRYHEKGHVTELNLFDNGTLCNN